MGFFSKLFWSKPVLETTPFESFLKRLAVEPQFGDNLILDTKSPGQIWLALCLGCFHSGYVITELVRCEIPKIPKLPFPQVGSKPFPFDLVAQEVIAFAFYCVCAEYMNDDDNDDDDDDDEKVQTSKEEKRDNFILATSIGEAVAGKYIHDMPQKFFSNRLRTYSFAAFRGKIVFEEAANHILKALDPQAGSLSNGLSDIPNYMAIQLILVSGVIDRLKKGLNDLYSAWQDDPDFFDQKK